MIKVGLCWWKVSVFVVLLIVVLSGVVAVIYGIGIRNVSDTKRQSREAAHSKGFTIQGYEGYQWCPFHGGDVWYLFQKKGSDITYNGYFARHPFSKEIHLYKIRALDALKGGSY
ncbi:hypothetical protein KAR10_09355 [bacterium]|nr:hypothetical protein [bacterium]